MVSIDEIRALKAGDISRLKVSPREVNSVRARLAKYSRIEAKSLDFSTSYDYGNEVLTISVMKKLRRL